MTDLNQMDEGIQEFLIESHGNLDQLEQELLQMENCAGDAACMDRVFRYMHTIKGSCGFFSFTRIERITHRGENLLSRAREAGVPLTSHQVSALLASVDVLRELLGAIEATGAEGGGDDAGLLARLDALVGAEWAADAPAEVEEVTIWQAPEPAAAPQAPEPAELPTRSAPGGVADQMIRVNVAHLDRLMNLVGELVLARNQILQIGAAHDGRAFQATSQRLNLITTELQEGVMRTRMQPIGNAWRKLPRMIRDLARQCEKRVQVELHGQETELDKTLLEAIRDPLVHLVRNVVDHGIEHPQLRTAIGKSAEGLLRLRAFHKGGQVNIEISDDGAGVDIERLKARAVERKLASAEWVRTCSEREALSLLFLPGLSTAERVSNISGRGVGMDVVRTNIENIGGTIDVQTEPDVGTTFRLKIPLTLAIIPALIITTGGERFAIPQVSLQELVRIEGGDGIERLLGTPVYRLRGHLLPLVYLSEQIRLRSLAGGVTNIVVLRADGRHFGLVVDEINDTEEIVVKPLSKQLKELSAFSGATIMGDGKVVLILDVLGLAQRAGVVEARQGPERTRLGDATAGDAAGDERSLLLVAVRGRGRLAVPLEAVSRLEDVPPERVEHTAGREVVQYRGRVMPLVRLGEVLGGGAPAAPTTLHVIVYDFREASVGVVVDSIIDIVSERVELQPSHETPGVRQGKRIRYRLAT